MTINKSQGQTMHYVGIYLPEPVFTHGQLYVGMSRNRDPDKISICVDDPKEPTQTANIVFKEVLEE
jgi:ATP-dependent DNA helicase PIF1